MSWGIAALLGVVQGLTEFLPVSSSAHLILARAFFGVDAEAAYGVAFDVACHVGTLLATLWFFRADVREMMRSLPRALDRAPGPVGRRIRLIVIGTIPVVIAGLLFHRAIEDSMRTPLIAAITLCIGGIAFFVVERLGPRTKGEDGLTGPGALAIGIAQAAALVPGVSRSGATIATAMALGIQREAAARFTFLLGIPAIVGVAAKEGLELRHAALSHQDAALMLIGMLTSAIVGYAVIRFFLRFLSGHRLDVFGWYRVALALVAFVWLAAH
jgi:undecaprenyl-diphosphatase